ncbi:hypothetical protein E4U42_005939 [Claviceps africana]|uniref:Methyltransferase n=1 Tax=Claviceps africana TaxID=83212 RepID=A0A8K0NH12_9HYPO|nr:hypothetical protein E4U42_005939 [Claviceps africana]
MESQSPEASERGYSLADTSPVQHRYDPEYTRAVLGIPALLEATSGKSQSSHNSTQHRHDTSTAGELSADTRVVQTHNLGDSGLPAFGHDNRSLGEIPTDTQPATTFSRATEQDHHDTLHMSQTAESSTVSGLLDTPVAQTHEPTRRLSSNPTVPAHPHTATTSRPNSTAAAQPSGQSAPDHEQDKEEGRVHERAQFGPASADHGEYSPQHDVRRNSGITSPLTHPNGFPMFPDLSTPEQDQLAHEALAQAEDTIVADNHDEYSNESDGGYDSDGFSSGSTSAESSVRDYMFENGRRYHRFREGHYNFPNEDVEQEREDMKHAMVKLLCSQKLHFAPIGNNPQEVLDIGTGTGIWAIEMGDLFPSAHILGIDLSPIQPDWLPPNVRFMVDDAESPWLYPRNHFDYIHSRNTVMAIKDWDTLYQRAFDHLKRGGWMEMQEIHHRPHSATMDGLVSTDHPVGKFWNLVTDGLAALGVDLDISSGGILASKMQQAGFGNVTERVFHVPIGTWPKNKVLKTVGLYWRTILLDGLQAIAMGPLTRGLRWNREQVEMLLLEVRQAYHDNSTLMYMPLHVTYAQKPLTAY